MSTVMMTTTMLMAMMMTMITSTADNDHVGMIRIADRGRLMLGIPFQLTTHHHPSPHPVVYLA